MKTFLFLLMKLRVLSVKLREFFKANIASLFGHIECYWPKSGEVTADRIPQSAEADVSESDSGSPSASLLVYAGFISLRTLNSPRETLEKSLT